MGLYPNSNFIERSNGDYTIEAARHMSGKFMVTLYKRSSITSTGRCIQSMKSFDHLHDAMNYTIQVVRNPHQYIWPIVQRLERYHSMLSERDRDTGEVIDRSLDVSLKVSDYLKRDSVEARYVKRFGGSVEDQRVFIDDDTGEVSSVLSVGDPEDRDDIAF